MIVVINLIALVLFTSTGFAQLTDGSRAKCAARLEQARVRLIPMLPDMAKGKVETVGDELKLVVPYASAVLMFTGKRPAQVYRKWRFSAKWWIRSIDGGDARIWLNSIKKFDAVLGELKQAIDDCDKFTSADWRNDP